MHITLHLTTRCNMRCSYCYSPPTERMDMTSEIIERTVSLSRSFSPANTGIIFFGGEPLLRKDLITETIERCRRDEKETGSSFHFKVTTNGLLLDRPFLEFAQKYRLQVAMSIDGIEEAHDQHRKTQSHAPTFELIEKKIDLLLSFQPYAYAFMTVTPETVSYYSESVNFLFEKGFRYIIASLNYAGEWESRSLKRLQKEYRRLSDIYERLTLKGKKFYFSPFEKKFASHIQGKDALCLQCHFGTKQISISPDGDIYPCVQFVQDGISNKDFTLGDVWNGIDSVKQDYLYRLSREENEACDRCGLAHRCEHRCSCLNWQTTGSIDEVSPVLCETERMLIPIVDNLGERLFRKRAPMFIQKHYNAAYPFISYIEDRL
jgi:uncharacterized protein